MGKFQQWLLAEGRLDLGDPVLLYRGIGQPNKFDRLGRWWSSNPYYSLQYGGLKPGQIFIAKVPQAQLQQWLQDGTVKDATQDEYPNYIFNQSDPPGARAMTPEEIMKFRQLSGDVDQNGQKIQATEPRRLGMSAGLFKQLWGQQAVDAGHQVFG